MAGRERQAVAAMVAATLLWGATFVVIRDSLDAIDPRSLVAVRFALATVVWLVVLGARALAGVRTSGVRDGLVGGLVAGPLAACGFLFQAIGLTTASAGSSAFLTSTGTLLAAFLAWPLLGQRPAVVLVAGTAVAFLGAALLGLDRTRAFGTGEAWTLLGAVAFAAQIVALARWAPRADPLVLSATQAAAIAAIVAPLGGIHLPAAPQASWARLGYLVMAGSLIAPWLQVWAQARLPAGRVGLLFTLEPVFALGFALTVGAEVFPAHWWLGAALVLSAVVWVEWRSGRARTRPASG